jgi:hypothetical protein
VAVSGAVATDLGWCRRRAKPLRIVILPKPELETILSPTVEPIPVLVCMDAVAVAHAAANATGIQKRLIPFSSRECRVLGYFLAARDVRS